MFCLFSCFLFSVFTSRNTENEKTVSGPKTYFRNSAKKMLFKFSQPFPHKNESNMNPFKLFVCLVPKTHTHKKEKKKENNAISWNCIRDLNLKYLWCSKCRRLLSMDIQSALLLPPVHRPYRKFSISKTTTQTSSSTNDPSVDVSQAYHIDCFPEEA